jgi:hypothetical protein
MSANIQVKIENLSQFAQEGTDRLSDAVYLHGLPCANEMTEKKTSKVEIKDTSPEEFGDFLKAISPKQEHPNREFNGIFMTYFLKLKQCK